MQKEISSTLLSPKADIEDSMSTPSLLKTLLLKKSQEISKPSAIVEFPLQNKKMTSKDKPKIFKNNIQKPTSFQMSALDSTSKEKVLKPYWNEFCKEKSLELWLPTKIDLLDSVMTSSNNWFNDPVGKSWFSTILHNHPNPNSQKISSTFCTSFRAECTDSEDTPKLSKKIRIYPSKDQQKCFQQWFAGNRYAFNIANEYLKQPGSKANWMNIKTDLLQILSTTKPFLKDVPYQIKSLAIKECCIAVSNAKRKFKIETQDMVTKNSRKLNSKSARNMMTLSFYKFSQILKRKAKKYRKIVLDCTEEYTSKTVSWNGEIKEKLGSARWITSEGITMDRDYNGARGILLKWLSKNSEGLGRSPSLEKSSYKSATSVLSNSLEFDRLC